MKIAIVVAEFNELITGKLLEGAKRKLEKNDRVHMQVVHVAGSFELPLMAKWLLTQGGADAVVALGAVIKGSTDHYQYVCSAVTSGLMSVQLETAKPVGFGVLMCENLEQALDRAGGKVGNKGAETAQTVLEMLLLKQNIV